ncbi:hypothetical protein [Proteiniphilum sp. UBA1028]|jgi:hypothetical protein|uniref:hypothetical protein n=1 Tax=Proteiniphilum sp. UBA1028 TaxID=1947251 RepID=UPI000E826BAB|nr:hypothetical protein [Proteiniphilum sp. UBA1028]HBG59061.1 hypothetical protein [Porphyromonadaceae bacterium]
MQLEKTGTKYRKLGKCILLDAVGMASAAIPAAAFVDVIWAPVAAYISYKMFGEKKGKYTSLITFMEELFPVTDIIPSFTLFWILFDFLSIGKEKERMAKVVDGTIMKIDQ